MQVGSSIFGEPGKTWNDTVCDNLDNGNYNEIQDYVQKVGKYPLKQCSRLQKYNTSKEYRLNSIFILF